MKAWSRFALTASFITCLPLRKLPAETGSEDWSGLSRYLPAVGLVLGLALAASAWVLAASGTGPLLSAALLAVLWLVLTGGIHFDGLMDAADGVFSHRDQARMLEVMRDSRVGNFGAMTGICVLVLKVAALASLPLSATVQAFVVLPMWARWCETYTIGSFPYLRAEGMGKVWHDTTRFPADVLLAGIVPTLVTVAAAVCGLLFPAIVAAAAIASGLVASHGLNGLLKGHTGDTYGAVVELSETAALVTSCLIIQQPDLARLIL